MSGSADSKPAIQTLLRQLRAGSRLGEAMSTDPASFPPVVVSMVQAGEAGGSLPATMLRLSAYLQRENDARQALRSALIYPAILLTTAGLSVTLVFTAVLPALRPMIDVPGKTLPIPVQLAFFISDTIQHLWWVFALAALVIVLGLRQALATQSGRLRRDRVLLRLPFIGRAAIHADLARFANTLGTLISGGLAMPAALQAALRVVSNRMIKDRLEKVRIAVQEGASLAEKLAATGIFPDLAVQMVRIGEATGQPDRMLIQLADILDEDLKRDIARALALLVPLLTIVLGVVVAGIVASVMLAVLSINDLTQ
jgi:general secretion pathway protein F